MNNSVYEKGLAVVLIIAIIIMAVLGIKLSGKVKNEREIVFTSPTEAKGAEAAASFIYVDIDGAVNNPGVFELTEGCRVSDAINAAGGLKEKADVKNLNRARKLTDGEKIYIFEEGEKAEEENEMLPKIIDINTATLEALKTLPGIGEVYGKRIIEYRNIKKFNSIEEIMNVQGIGTKTFEKLKEIITVN